MNPSHLTSLLLFSLLLFVSCKDDEAEVSVRQNEEEPVDSLDNTNGEGFVLPYASSPIHDSGIPLFTMEMGHEGRTELGTVYAITNRGGAQYHSSVVRNGYNSALRIDFKNMSVPASFVELNISAFTDIYDKIPLPKDLQEQITGVKFKLAASGQRVNMVVEAKDLNHGVIASQTFSVEQDTLQAYSLDFDSNELKYFSFNVSLSNQDSTFDNDQEASIIIDDVYFENGADVVFTPPENDTEFLNWLQETAIRFYIWNYYDFGNGQATIWGSNHWYNVISSSGMAFGMAAYILAEDRGMMTPEEVKTRIVSMLRYLQAQDWYNGQHGWKGFPHHWLNIDGTANFSDVSTVDWAICAAGIRVVKQYYANDPEVTSIADELLARPQWSEVFDEEGLIAMGINYGDGEINPWRWGASFTEEGELTFLEARNTGQVDKAVFANIKREKLYGYFPGWWSTGFEFNWMQMWTGPVEPFITNSTIAYNNDAATCLSAFNRPIMGLTAVGIPAGVTPEGFIWHEYSGDHGHSPNRSNDNKTVAPSPYGAAIALAFVPDKALTGLREYVKLGYYHQLTGFPSSVRLRSLGSDTPDIIPNWGISDLEAGPIAIGIDQMKDNIIGQLYQKDPQVQIALKELIESVNF